MRGKIWKRVQGGFLAACLLLSGCSAPKTEPVDTAAIASTAVLSKAVEKSGWLNFPVIAHAMGTVDGRTETNSLDAFLESYEAGHRVFEVDLQLTSDGHLIARHDWDQISYYNLEQTYAGVMDLKTFQNTPICFFYTPMTIDDMVALMKQYPDIYFVTDSKDTDETTIRAQMKEIRRAVQEAGDPSLWKRFIVQIYHEDMYQWVVQETLVTNWIFTLYQIEKPDYEKIGTFCQIHGIPVVTVSTGRLTPEDVKILHSYNCLIYIHTVNRLRGMLELSWCADGFYSDYVTPDQLKAAAAGTNQMYLGSLPEAPQETENTGNTEEIENTQTSDLPEQQEDKLDSITRRKL